MIRGHSRAQSTNNPGKNFYVGSSPRQRKGCVRLDWNWNAMNLLA